MNNIMNALDALIESSVTAGELESGLDPRWVDARSRGRGDGHGDPAPTTTRAAIVRRVGPGKRRASRAPTWQMGEDEFLRRNLGVLSEREMAARLGRTPVGVHLRWKRELRLPAPSKAPDILTAEQIAEGLGVDGKSVHLLIDRGILTGRRLPTDDVTRVVLRITLLRFITNPRNWCYIDPHRIGLRGPRRTLHTYDHGFWQRARSLALRALARWDDEWWTPGQAGRYHGVNHRLINRDIHQGKLPAVRWGNWNILRSDAVRMKYSTGKGHGHEREWSEGADAFLILADAVGLSTNAISAMCGWRTGTVSYRLQTLRRKGLVREIARKYGLKIQIKRGGHAYADWRDYRARFPRLARAMDKLKSGERMSQIEILLARGALLKESERRRLNLSLRGRMSERRLREMFGRMNERV